MRFSAITITAALATALAPLSAHAREFYSSDVQPADYPTVQAVQYMGKLIEERTAGRLKIRSLGYDSQESENFRVAQVRMGTIDIARVNVSAFHSIVPETIPTSLPFLFRSNSHLRRVLDAPVGEEILAAFESKGFVALCFYDTGTRSFYSAKKAIRSAADLTGMRVRTQQSKTWVKMVQALGAKAVPLPYNQVYAALANDTIDAAENNLPAYLASRHYEVAKIYSVVEHSAAPSVVVFSKTVWDRLPAADQEIIRRAARESVPYMRMLWEQYETVARRALVAAGVDFVTDVDKASFIDSLTALHSSLVVDPRLEGLLKRIRAAD